MVRTAIDRRLAALLLALAAVPAQALEVFACEPEWAALTRALAPQARISSATHALQDPHHIEARPALIAALRRADLAVCTGAGLEAGWLPMLQQRAGNARVQDGKPGMFYVEDHAELIDKRSAVGWNEGHVHAQGNPHLQLDPRRLLSVAAALTERLAQLDPAGAAQTRSRHAAWAADWQGRIAAWELSARPLKGRTLVGQHSTFAYLWAWLGLRQVADLEPKPGLPPTMSHLQQLQQQQTAAERPLAVVLSLYQDEKAGRWLSGQARLPLLRLPSTVTDEGPSASLAGLFDQLLGQLLAAQAGR